MESVSYNFACNGQLTKSIIVLDAEKKLKPETRPCKTEPVVSNGRLDIPDHCKMLMKHLWL
jgi:hypothetical protein